MTQQVNRHASSTGQTGTGAAWLDVHFEASRPEYEAQLRAVGIQPGWHVLDGACGSGSFLPWLADLVGPEGRLAAFDLAPENLALVEHRVAGWQLPCPVEARVANAVALPYPDDTFDAVWFANTTQYLTDEELRTALTEFRRVVRPGGLVAIKEIDASLYRVHPAPAGLCLRFFQAITKAKLASQSGKAQVAAILRTPALPGWLRRAGLAEVWARTTLIERAAPLDPATRSVWHDSLAVWANATVVAKLDLPAADQEVWAQLRHPKGMERFLDDPDCSFIEGNVLAVGTVPAEADETV